MQHVMSMMKKELMTGKMEEDMALSIFWRERSRPNMRMACTQERKDFFNKSSSFTSFYL